MKMQLPSGDINVFITHIHPDLRLEDINKSQFKREAFDLLNESVHNVNDANGTVAVITKDNKVIGQGKALLAKQDTFCKHTGLKVALARALKQAKISKEDRVHVWNRIFLDRYNHNEHA